MQRHALKAHQLHCDKPIRDTRHHQVTARRYRCLKCARTFHVYPTGLSHDQQSDTLKGVSVLLYVLGLSYQGVADLLVALQYPLAKSTVAGKVKGVGVDFAHVKCHGQARIVAVATVVLTGQPLTFEWLESETAFHTERWIRGIAQHPVPWELRAQGGTVDQFLEGLSTVEHLIGGGASDGQPPLERLAIRYQYAPPLRSPLDSEGLRSFPQTPNGHFCLGQGVCQVSAGS